MNCKTYLKLPGPIVKYHVNVVNYHDSIKYRPCCCVVGVMGTASAVLTLWMMEQAARNPSTVRRASTVLPLRAVQETTFQSSTLRIKLEE